MPNVANNTKLVIINRCGSIQEKIDESIKWNGKYQNKPQATYELTIQLTLEQCTVGGWGRERGLEVMTPVQSKTCVYF